MAPADLSEVFAGHGVAVAYLFGSRAEGTAGPASDYDVAVLFAEPEPALDATVRLATDLSALLGAPVDVVDPDRAGLELRGRVAERGRRLYSVDEPRRVRFEVGARRRWIEFRPVVRETTRAYLRGSLRRAGWCALLTLQEGGPPPTSLQDGHPAATSAAGRRTVDQAVSFSA